MLKKKSSSLENALYCLACISSLGIIYLVRVLITTAIRHAIKDE